MSYWKSYSNDPFLTSISQVSATMWNVMYNGVYGGEFDLERAFGFSMTPTNEFENPYKREAIPGMSTWYQEHEKEGKELIKKEYKGFSDDNEDLW